MTIRRFAVAAILLPAALATTASLAQTPSAPPSQSETPTPEIRARLLDGRMAMIKESLKLDAAQLKLWAPVEAQLRASFAAREQARAERRARRQSGERAALPDRLDRASQRATERAQRIKALAEALRPFYASLSAEQKAVADTVLRPRGPGLDGGRWHMRRASAGGPR